MPTLRVRITETFYENDSRYGYRRIHAVLKAEGVIASEKVVCRIMREERLVARRPVKRKYNSYVGEISDAPGNTVNHGFHASAPNMLSKKGCSPDNSAMEGFFGRLKAEFFYDRDWTGWTIEQCMDALDEYIHWYDEKRIKMSLGGMSPMQCRESLGFAA